MIRKRRKSGAKIYDVDFSDVNFENPPIVIFFTAQDDDEKMKTVIKMIITVFRLSRELRWAARVDDDGAKHYDKIINFRRIKGINYRRVCWCMKLEMFDSVAKIEHRTQDNTNAPLIFHSTTTVNGCILMQINVSQQPGRVLLSFPKHSSRNIRFTIFYSISCNFLLLSSPPEHRKREEVNWKITERYEM